MSHQLTRFPNQLRVLLLPIMVLVMASIVFAMLASTVSAAGGARSSSNDYTLVSGNDSVDGIWSDGTTMWVLDRTTPKVYAYVVSTKARDSSKDIDSLSTAGNGGAHGIWSDGTTMWISDRTDDKIYAYNLSNGSTHSSKDIPLHADNGSAESIWSDGTTIWVANDNDDKLYAYNLSTKARDSGKDFSGLSAAGNEAPRGMWSDGVTMWVSDHTDDKLYAYNVSDKTRVENPAGTYPQDFNLTSDNSSPQGVWSDGDTFWVANTFSNGDNANPNRKLYAYQSYPVATGVTARSVGPSIAQIIVSLDNILQGFSAGSNQAIHIRYRVASPPGGWTSVQVNAGVAATEVIYKIASGLVAGTEYDIEASISSAFVPSVNTTHTHLGTTLIIFDTRDNELYEFSDLSDLTTHTDHGDLANVGTVRTMEEHEGWLYLVNATNHDLYRSRTPRTVSSWTNKLGTWSGLGGGSQSVISANGNLYEITSTSIGRVVNPSDPSAGFTDITILGFSPTGAVYYDGVLYLISGTHIRVIPDIDNPTVGVTTTLTGMTHGRGMTVFNDRVLMNEEDDRQIFELQNLDTTPTALLLGTYTSDLYYGSSIAVWLDLPAPIVSSVSIDSILDTSVTANITATDATSAGVDFRFRYRIGDTGPWTDATSVNSSTTTAAISVTGLTATQAYNYQASLDSVYPADDRTEGTFTTVETAIAVG